jgi:Na+/H+-dicarboxylate symporter
MPSVPKNLRPIRVLSLPDAMARSGRLVTMLARGGGGAILAQASKGARLDEVRADEGLVSVRLPAAWTLAGLVAGVLVGWALGGTRLLASLLAVAGPVGALWLRALQVTIVPLVAALLVVGIAQMAQAARAGAAARRMLGWMALVLTAGALASAVLVPWLLDAFPPPASAAANLLSVGAARPEVPKVADFLGSLVAPNIVAAAAENAMLPLTLFFAMFALALVRLPDGQRALLLGFFRALGNAMLMIIGWVLWLAPVGVFALAIGVAATGGGATFATLGHYIVTVATVGVLILIGSYLLAWLVGGIGPLRFARAMIPAQAVALSTQSSLASLPAMLDSARRLGLRQSTADFVLPLAVAIFRSTSPAMNLAVAIYVAHLAGVAIGSAALVSAIAVALVISVGTVSLPGSISFVVSIGPIALALGAPLGPLGLLVAVEMLPDIVRTLANVTCDVAVAAAVDRAGRETPARLQP